MAAKIPQPPAAGGPADAPARARLRREAAVRALVGVAVAAALAFWKPVLGGVVGGIALLVLAAGLVAPVAVYARLATALDRFARAVGTAVTWLLMPLLFYGLFLPVGLLLRATGKLAITRGPDPARATYWEAPRAGHDWTAGAAAHRKQF